MPAMSLALPERLDHCPSGRNGFPAEKSKCCHTASWGSLGCCGTPLRDPYLKPVGCRSGFLEGN